MSESTPATARLRKIGARELTLPAIGLGCAALSGFYGAVKEADGVRVIRQALGLGLTLLETGPSSGRANGVVRQALIGRRDRAIVVAGDRTGDVERACDTWLRELDTDHLDLFYVSHSAAGLEEVVGRVGALVTAGKVRHIGLSDVSADQLRRAHRVHPVTALVREYSLMHRDIEAEVLPVARSLGIGVIAGRPLGRGFLTGRIRAPEHLSSGDLRRLDPRFRGERLLQSVRRLPLAEEMAAELNVSLSRLALAWLLGQGDDVVVVPSTRNPLHLEMNVAAQNVRLTPEQRARLERIFTP
ncbi:aldo/keto reductase [Nonomuraea africana]|uniref:aldo/keto reductase n=1 Tax=Nonomuraea africana TaxID=46171 RepID=UPI0033D731FE